MKRLICMAAAMVVILLLAGCAKQESGKEVQAMMQANYPLPDGSERVLDDANEAWRTEFNKEAGAVGKCYFEQAILFFETKNAAEGSDAIDAAYRAEFASVGEIEKIVPEIRLAQDEVTVLEAGTFAAASGETYQYLIRWAAADGGWKRELEAVARKTGGADLLKQIEKVTKRYVISCMKHDVAAFVEELYAENASYVNQGIHYIGRGEIASAFGYMAYPDYTLSLQTVWTSAASDSLVYSVGEFTSRGKGLYLLVCEKQEGGEFKILLDSN